MSSSLSPSARFDLTGVDSRTRAGFSLMKLIFLRIGPQFKTWIPASFWIDAMISSLKSYSVGCIIAARASIYSGYLFPSISLTSFSSLVRPCWMCFLSFWYSIAARPGMAWVTFFDNLVPKMSLTLDLILLICLRTSFFLFSSSLSACF